MTDLVYLNGALIPLNEAKISILDYGFLFGYGLFETMRAYSGKIFRLNSHLERLKKSADGMSILVNIAELETAVTDTILANHLLNARVRLTVTIGEGSSVPDPQTCGQPTVLVVATKYISYPPEVYQRGYRVITSSIRRNSQSPVPRMKTLNYLESLLSRGEAKNAGMDDALLLNENGHLAEATTSNVFLVSHNTLRTPRMESGILPGVTRGIILELAAGLGVKAVEADISPGELLRADEAFLTNSVIEIMSVTAVNGKTIGSGEPGTLTQKLTAAYKNLVIREC